jgi:alkylhydroperoxidase family enzyme
VLPMDQRTTASPRLMPLPPEHSPELKEQFEAMRKNLGFIPNSILIMQRKPTLAKALAQMTAAVWDPEGKVDRGFKRIIAHVASRAAGCQYCMAHTAAQRCCCEDYLLSKQPTQAPARDRAVLESRGL